MLPRMCRKLACMNIELKAVTQVAGWEPGLPTTPGLALAGDRAGGAFAGGTLTSPQWSPGWVNSYGIAPQRTVTLSEGPLKKCPPWRISSRYTTTLIAIRQTVTSGNRASGMLSLSGNTVLALRGGREPGANGRGRPPGPSA